MDIMLRKFGGLTNMSVVAKIFMGAGAILCFASIVTFIGQYFNGKITGVWRFGSSVMLLALGLASLILSCYF